MESSSTPVVARGEFDLLLRNSPQGRTHIRLPDLWREFRDSASMDAAMRQAKDDDCDVPHSQATPHGVACATLSADRRYVHLRANLAWHENVDGRGTFAEAQTIDVRDDLRSLEEPVDLDGDGDRDLVFSVHSGGSVADIRWYENTDGLGRFAEGELLTTNSLGAASLSVADLNADDRVDFILTSPIKRSVSWVPQDETGVTFGAPIELSTRAPGESRVQVTDWDGDGDRDLLIAAKSDRLLFWLENIDNIGTFSEERLIDRQAGRVDSLQLGDIDGDGTTDLLA